MSNQKVLNRGNSIVLTESKELKIIVSFRTNHVIGRLLPIIKAEPSEQINYRRFKLQGASGFEKRSRNEHSIN